MSTKTLAEGTLVRHPGKPEWGIGKVLFSDGRTAKVSFEHDPKDVRELILAKVSLEICDVQSHPLLDRLPPFVDGAFETKAGRVTIEDGIEAFKRRFPLGFRDPSYLETQGDESGGERNYKWRAHERYQEAFGDGRGKALLESGEIDALRENALAIVTRDKMNMLSPYEAMAFREGLADDDDAARNYFAALFAFIDSGPDQSSFSPLATALTNLPVEQGRARAATWPVMTLLPFLADPSRFTFLKPEPTKACADRLRFNLLYDSALQWTTYERLLTLGRVLRGKLRPLGARDFIDVQSFMWVIEKY